MARHAWPSFLLVRYQLHVYRCCTRLPTLLSPLAAAMLIRGAGVPEYVISAQ